MFATEISGSPLTTIKMAVNGAPELFVFLYYKIFKLIFSFIFNRTKNNSFCYGSAST